FRSCREPEEESRLEMLDQTPIGGRGCMMEFVDDDVIESVWREAIQMGGIPERLDRCEQDVGFGLLDLSGIAAEISVRPDSAERRERLGEDLIAMRYEENASVLRAIGIERGEPGLAYAGGKHHEARAKAFLTRSNQRIQRLSLDRVGLRNR